MSLAPPHLSPSPLAPGYKLDRYELLCPIAEGGMASVWIARQTGKHGFQKLVAIKTILPKYASEPTFQQMFLDEVRIASRIEHANVTQILDVGEQHDVTYLVMEYVDGDALSKLHRAARDSGRLMSQGVLLRVMADVCGGLHAAHELHAADGKSLCVVHRDVSPQNILVSTRGVSKLIDFGIAKAKNRLAEDTNAGQLKGKVRYMAPEQALGHPVDRRADVWAVGAVLYHLLSGRAPFEGENEVKTLFLLTSGRPPTPMRGNVHPAVAAVVRRALSHEPSARYATAAEMEQALEGAIKEAGLVTTTMDVASYVTKEMAARAFKRKEAISLGLSAADARERYADIMRANTERSHGGTSATGARVMAEQLTAKADQVASEDVTGRATSPASASKSATGQTLGSAAIAIQARDGARGLRLAIVGCIVGAAISVLALGALQGPKDRAAAAASMPRESAPATLAPRMAPVTKAPETPLPSEIPPPPPAASDAPSASVALHPPPPAATAGRVEPLPVYTAIPAASSPPPASPPPAARATRPAPAPTVVPRVNDGF